MNGTITTSTHARSLLSATIALAMTICALQAVSACQHPAERREPPEKAKPEKKKETEPKERQVALEIRVIEPPKPTAKPRPSKPKRPPAAPKRPEPKPELPVLADRTFVPTAGDFIKGDRLLKGRFPRLLATYERVGFERYRDLMIQLGGAFYVWDGAANQPLARIDPKTGETWEEPVRAELSRWPRDVSKHLGAEIERSREHLGHRATHVVLLPPSRFDAALLSGLDRLLRRNGVDPRSVDMFFGAYEVRFDGLYCVVLSASVSGEERPVSFAIKLSGAGA